MRKYAKVSPRFWTSGSGKRLRGDADAQLLALHLLTGPSSTMLGLYYVPLPTIAHELGWGIERVSKGYQSLAQAGFAAYDVERDLCWVPNAFAFEVGDGVSLGTKHRQGIVKQLCGFGNHPFALDFLFRHGRQYGIKIEGLEGLELAQNQIPIRYPLPWVSAFADQKQDQDQKKEYKDLVIPLNAEVTRSRRRKRSPDEQDAHRRIRVAFFAGHEKFYGRRLEQWGSPENAHLYHLMTSTPVEVLERKALAYHEWRHPEVIRAGHPFMKHRWSFSATLTELEADMVAPDRRKLAAQAQKQHQDSDRASQQQDQAARIAAQILGGSHAGQQAIDFAPPLGSAGPDNEDFAPVRDVLAPAFGSGDEDVG